MTYVPWRDNPQADGTTPDGRGSPSSITITEPSDGYKAPVGFAPWPKVKKKKRRKK